MKTYVGTKTINAKPMTRAAYNEFRGWALPADENGDDEGYLVEYTDGGKPNTPHYEGYVSWSPREQFEKAYHEVTSLSFSDVVRGLKAGKRFSRSGWNGRGMFVFLVPGSRFKINREPLLSILGEGTEVDYRGHIDIKNVDGSISTWVPSIGDVLGEDWQEA